MSRSYDFCKKRCADQALCGFYDRKWDDVQEYPFIAAPGRKPPYSGKLKADDMGISIDILFDPNADFQYFTSYVAYTDGTMIFELEAMQKLFNRLLQCGTYFNKMEAPHDGAHITYTVGNFVVVREYGKEFAPKEKPWMTERLTVMLPINYQIEEQGK